MSRCRACNASLKTSEDRERELPDGSRVREDLCRTCRSKAYEQDTIFSIYYDDDTLISDIISGKLL